MISSFFVKNTQVFTDNNIDYVISFEYCKFNDKTMINSKDASECEVLFANFVGLLKKISNTNNVNSLKQKFEKSKTRNTNQSNSNSNKIITNFLFNEDTNELKFSLNIKILNINNNLEINSNSNKSSVLNLIKSQINKNNNTNLKNLLLIFYIYILYITDEMQSSQTGGGLNLLSKIALNTCIFLVGIIIVVGSFGAGIVDENVRYELLIRSIRLDY
jgi:hypothetical protein